jgi:hypothetical protein
MGIRIVIAFALVLAIVGGVSSASIDGFGVWPVLANSDEGGPPNNSVTDVAGCAGAYQSAEQTCSQGVGAGCAVAIGVAAVACTPFVNDIIDAAKDRWEASSGSTHRRDADGMGEGCHLGLSQHCN